MHSFFHIVKKVSLNTATSAGDWQNAEKLGLSVTRDETGREKFPDVCSYVYLPATGGC